ncbi:MAG: MFS transporter [Alphaproteobacteria bacterium]|nr:MFS transporter [Alphaproteobacteria bacterium]
MAPFSLRALAPYLLLFAALYAGFGVQSPYLPAFLAEHGLAPELIGIVLAGATAIKLVTGPAAGRLADRLGAARMVFAGCAIVAALSALGYLPAYGFWVLFAIALLQAAALGPLAPLADSLVLPAAAPPRNSTRRGERRGFDYGWVRGTGSGAFILGSILSGQLVGTVGLAAAIWLNAGLLAAAALWAPRVRALPPRSDSNADPAPSARHIGELLRLPAFRRVVVVAALILGSHALHDGFAMIRWQAAGVVPGTAGLLWAESVAAEVVVFFAIGRPLLDRLGANGAAMLAAVAGIVRWCVSAQTAALPALALIQPLHGLTFALLHLACMRRLAEAVPPGLSATALTLYGTVAIGAASALLTLASGELYGAIGPQGFWIMAALCAIALPFARRL